MSSNPSAEIQRRAARVKLLLMDCDGVLTDGRVWILEEGEDQKAFHTHDGFGIDLWHRAGLRSGVISGRVSSALQRRASALGMSFISPGSVDKVQTFAQILAEAGVSNQEVAYIGDDLPDIPLMVQAGFSVAVADAVPEVRERAHYVTNARGGYGAVREVIELILKAQGRWTDVVKDYLDPHK